MPSSVLSPALSHLDPWVEVRVETEIHHHVS
jgi:hypothetical protein